MKRLFAGLVLVAAAATLSGCYYDPGYSYVRSTGYGGDAYYGQGTRVYDDGYYVAPGYYDGGYYGSGGYGSYYGGGYGGCCYAPGVSVGISSTWYGGSRYRDDRRGAYRGGDRDHDGRWQGRGESGNRIRGDSDHHDGGDHRKGERRGHGDDSDGDRNPRH